MTIPNKCKRLAEVDFPISEVSKHSVREKAGPSGHISTLHLWWARRPLGSSRAMLMALLLPDPLDPLCPSEFKDKAREILGKIQKTGPSDTDLRTGILKFIGAFSSWDVSANPVYLSVARDLIYAAHPDEVPMVVDPFAGGGSIPLEALRLGCDTFASDLNPVAGLIEKVMLEEIPRYSQQPFRIYSKEGEIEVGGLAEALHLVGAEIKSVAEKRLEKFYPPDPDGARPAVYIWARTIRCESPNCGAEIPLMRSFWLSKRANGRKAIKPIIKRPQDQVPSIEFEIFTPANEDEVISGTIKRARARCLCCNNTMHPDSVRAQLKAQSGGGEVIFDKNGFRVSGARLVAVVSLINGKKKYRLPTEVDYQTVLYSQKSLYELLQGDSDVVPNESLPFMSGVFNVPIYGIDTWGKLFTARQKVALAIWQKTLKEWKLSTSYHESLLLPFALTLSRVTMCGMTLTNWNAFAEKMQHVFGKQALPMIWDFAEVVSTQKTPGSWQNALDLVCDVVNAWSFRSNTGQVQLADATASPLPNETTDVWFTDPPYYFAVPYADLSDFFYVWLKRLLPDHQLLKDPFDPDNPMVPKERELCEMAHWDPERYAHKNKQFFEVGMAQAFSEGRRLLKQNGIGCVVFAHKTTEGWESLLTGMIKGGWTISASWPIATESETRLRARESAALATSVHLVCRPRSENASVGDWGQVSRELPKRVRDWMARLQTEGVRGADLVFSCIGPALEIYSRYAKVVDAEDREIPLGGDPEASEPYRRGYLAYVWEVVGRLALEQVLGAGENASGALEEDARLTALFLWTLQSTNGENAKVKIEHPNTEDEGDEDEEGEFRPKKAKGGYSLIFDVARRFAQPLGIHLPDWENRIIETEKGIVRLYSVSERAKQLFGEEGAQAFVNDLNHDPAKAVQLSLLPNAEPTPKPARARAARRTPANVQETVQRREATTLDRLHAAMLLQKSGQSSALRALLEAENERGSDFMRLANALSALYPRDSEEKRLLDALLVNIRR